VGSAFIRKVQEAGSLQEALENVKKLASELAEGIKSARRPEKIFKPIP
jgi:tryptophan synthase alpha subunit